jgi:hypothetical protein
MPALRAALLFIGILATFVGLVWLSQGLGYIPATETPRIMNLKPWTYCGMALAAAGIAVIVVSRRIGRPRP